jgi:hypothetical protein
MSREWSVPCEWPKECCFVIGGGPSVLGQDIKALRGRRVIVINSSVYAAPWADFLFFGDWRWWNEPDNRAAVAGFGGRVVTTSRLVRGDPKVQVCKKTNPPGLATAPNSLMQKWTSLTAATNLAAHLVGPGGTIVWLGADGKVAPDRTHHHKPHRWPHKPGCYDKQLDDLKTIVPSLREMGIAAFNASPGTAWTDLLPPIDLTELLTDQRRAA